MRSPFRFVLPSASGLTNMDEKCLFLKEEPLFWCCLPRNKIYFWVVMAVHWVGSQWLLPLCGGVGGCPITCDKKRIPLRDGHGSIMALQENEPREQSTLYLRGTAVFHISSSSAAGTLPHGCGWHEALAQQWVRHNKLSMRITTVFIYVFKNFKSKKLLGNDQTFEQLFS